MRATVRIVRLRLHQLHQWWRWQGLRIALLPWSRPDTYAASSADAPSADTASAHAAGADAASAHAAGADADATTGANAGANADASD